MIYLENTYADLVSNVLATWYGRKFPPGTRFLRIEHGKRAYWYADVPKGKRVYLGRDTPELAASVMGERDLAATDRDLRAMVRALKGAGMPVPGESVGETLHAVAWSGFFRLRGVLVGTLAFQTYFPMFGERPADFFRKAGLSGLAASRTADIDLAQFHSISIAVGDRLEEPFKDVLGPDFSQVPAIGHGKSLPKWRNSKTGLMVDLLAPLRAPYPEDDTFLPSMGVRASKLKFLDFLIHDEIPAVVLHRNGVPVNVPRPERYAVHKLVISQERRNPVKAEKDMLQAVALFRHLLENRSGALRDALSEAAERGPGWRGRLAAGFAARAMPEDLRRELGPLVKR